MTDVSITCGVAAIMRKTYPLQRTMGGQARLFEAAGVSTDNLTHHHRDAGARHAHNSGCDIKDIERHARWNMNRLMLHHLDMASSIFAIKMAAFTSSTVSAHTTS
ncbi:hypothetical protein BG011_005106 [Mortierella polycephala]|uniref:Uncharacterized protein n=1 Tax=Mortierella polycephala TaxID=41804 RepID=A0A9P6PZW5_9FUNG|nr:hypothetical protein BG011_005106 [Mortierella polycephala]